MCLTGSAETEQSVPGREGKIAQQLTLLHPRLWFQPVRARQLLSGWVGVRREKETEQTKGEEREEGERGKHKQSRGRKEKVHSCSQMVSLHAQASRYSGNRKRRERAANDIKFHLLYNRLALISLSPDSISSNGKSHDTSSAVIS